MVVNLPDRALNFFFVFFVIILIVQNSLAGTSTSLDAPVATAATSITDNSFRVNANAVTGASYYLLDVSTNPSFSSFVGTYNSQSFNLGGTVSTGIVAGTTYYYRLRAFGAGSSAYSNVISVLTLPSPPVTGNSNITGTSFDITWPSVVSATEYRLDVSTRSSFSTYVNGYQDLLVSSGVSIVGLAPRSEYYYRIRSKNGSGVSANSAVIMVTTTLAAPVAKVASAVTTSTFTANWDDVAGATEYYIDISEMNDFSSFVAGFNNMKTSSLPTSKPISGDFSAGGTYFYRVRAAVTRAGTSEISINSNVISVLTLPSVPNPATSNATATSFDIVWQPIRSAIEYRLDVSTNPQFSPCLVGYQDAIISATSITVTGLATSTKYYYRIRSKNATGASINSSVISTSTLLNTPLAKEATSTGTNSFIVNADPVVGASSYRLDVSTNSDFTSYVGIYNSFGVTLGSVVGTNISPGTTYFYRIKAVSGNFTSAYSNVISVLTLPAPPTGFTVTSKTSNGFILSWNSVQSANNYEVDISTDNGFVNLVSGFAGLSVTSQNVNVAGLVPNTGYFCRVRALNATGKSVSSASVNTGTATLAPVVDFATGASPLGFTANWTKVTGAISYHIDISTKADFSTLLINDVDAGPQNFYKATGLVPTTKYWYRVRALNSFATSSNSDACIAETCQNVNYIKTEVILVAGSKRVEDIQTLDFSKKSVSYDYFDGLGRIVQTVAKGESPNQFDVVLPFAYDSYGREVYKYLPYTDESNGYFKTNALRDPLSNQTNELALYRTGKQYAFYQTGGIVAKDQFPYTETRFDPSSLGRPLEKGAPGASWQPDGTNSYASSDRTIKYSYEVNSTGEVVRFNYLPQSQNNPLGTVTVGAMAYYQTGQLFKFRTKDEQGNEAIEFEDKQGRIILKKIQVDASSYAQTYYIYDDMGNLVCVLQPEAIKSILSNMLITWDNKVGTQTDISNTLSTTVSVTGYGNSGATSTFASETLAANTDGWVETTAGETNTARMIGLAPSNVNSGASIQYALELAGNGKIYQTENGAVLAPYTAGTVIRVSREGSAIKYYVDGVLKATSSTPCTSSLIVDAALGSTGATLQNVVTSFRVNPVLSALVVNYGFLYTYDLRGRITQKKVPGAAPIYMVYDGRDRLVMTQDGNQRADKYWYFTKYDASNRPVLTGIYQADSVLIQSKMQRRVNAFYDAVPGNGGAWYESYSGGTAVHGYDNKSYPKESTPDNYLTANYYDNYSFSSLWTGYAYINDGLATGAYVPQRTIIGRLTGSKIKVLDGGVRGGSTWLKSINYYDDRYRVIQTQSENIRGGKDILSKQYDFTGKVMVTMTTHSTSIPSSYVITRRFIYDHAGRLTELFHKIGSNGTEYRVLYNQYNELGQLVDKKLHSIVANATDSKQSVDYRYNIRGWLTSMNNSQLTNDAGSSNTNDDSGDFFGMNLLYNDAIANLGNSSLYNGNISGMMWSTNLGLSDVKEAGYNFTYDAMSRLTAANSKMNKTGAWQAGYYDENGLKYDLNGNLKTLIRNGDNNLQIDNLSYNYGTTGNQLQYVQDGASTTVSLKGFGDFNTGTAVDYTYDANGNMTRDLNKGIGTTTTDAVNLITYNYLNLPETVTKAGNTVRYIYDATGKKLSQVVTFGTTQKQTDYIGEFQYENNALQFINHEEGRVVVSATKLMYTNTFDVVSSDFSKNGIQTPVIYTSGAGEKYLQITSAGTANGTGTPQIGSLYSVQPGERYKIRVKGYSTTVPVYLQVQVGGSLVSSPGTKLPNGVGTESWVEQIVTIPAGSATTMKAGIVWSNAVAGESYYLNEFEISQLTTQVPEYQYNLKDHLGNVRLTFTTVPETVSDIATLESANAANERNKFLRYDNARIVGHYLFDHTNGSAPTTVSGGAQRLSGQTNEVYGLGKSLSVMPGDVIAMEVYAKYIDKTVSNRTGSLNTLLTQIASGPGGGANVVDGSIYSSSTSSFGYAGLNNTAASTGTGPKAYLNWIVFDKNYNIIPSLTGYQRLSSAPRETGQDVAHEKLSGTLDIKEPGYVYIYYSNEEGATAYEVYFDDFKVTQTKSSVIASNDYYPFGLAISSYYRENSAPNQYLYNSKELQDELNLGWLDFGARIYQPEIARWTAVDPATSVMPIISPYAYSFNNPVKYVDKDGACPIIPMLIKAGIAGAADLMMQMAMNYYFDDKCTSFEAALDNVNWWQVSRSSAEGMLPWSVPGGRYGKASATAIGDIMVNALDQGSNYSGEQALKDFAIGFIGDLAGGGLGDLINKYGGDGVARGLSRMGFDAHTIEKLTGILDWNFSSGDPLVGDLANSIDNFFGKNTVQEVGAAFRNGLEKGDVDISLSKFNIEVKSGRRPGFAQSAKNSANAKLNGKQYILYFPKATKAQKYEAKKWGITLYTTEEELFNALKEEVD